MNDDNNNKTVSPEKKESVLNVERGCCFCSSEEGSEAKAHSSSYKLHSTNWLAEYPDNLPNDIFEVRFKHTHRGYYRNVNNLDLKEGDIVAVEASPGHDIGIISLTGDLVARQMKRVGFNPQNGEFRKIYRKAKSYDIERWQEAIALEHDTMIRAREIAADMNLNMKIGDVEYQGDKIKAIFYYIAEGRVDFRELIKVFAERFHIRIEMKQIGARQEAGRIGGIGACGRELCCASWISSFSSVTTNAARVQDISLNPLKLAGQCSKLKCCLMYEYDVYADARQKLPRVREPLQAVDGEYYLVKTDILAHTMSFSSSKETLSNMVTIPASRVREIIAMNRAGKRVESLIDKDSISEVEEPTFRTEEDSITRFDNQNKRRRNKNNKGRQNNNRGGNNRGKSAQGEGSAPAEEQRERGGHNRDERAGREARENRENREPREPRENREPREPREGNNENRQRRDNRNGRGGRNGRDGRFNNHRRDDNRRRDSNRAEGESQQPQQPKQE